MCHSGTQNRDRLLGWDVGSNRSLVYTGWSASNARTIADKTTSRRMGVSRKVKLYPVRRPGNAESAVLQQSSHST